MALYKPGESGNPGGRPKAATGLRQELDRRYGDDAKVLLDQLDAFRNSDNEKIRLDAVKLALAYHCGQPTQRLEHAADVPAIPGAITFVIQQQPDSDNRT